MNFREMTKEQRQRFILVGLAGVVGLVVVLNFVLRPLRDKWTSTRSRYEAMSAQLDDANSLLKREVELRQELVVMREKMRHATRECIPDPENSLSWVTKRVYEYARTAGVEIQSVSSSSSRASPFSRGEESDRTFSMFAVDIMIQCAYQDLMNFIQEIETRNPYLCVSGMIISGDRLSPDRHKVNIDLQWPIWADPEAAAEARAKVDGEHG